ncbi:hypothetical protein L1049_016429 [Liquidambar formosana]|uniref:Uncharacterized protein n=1 Tax=Liquidambar formosana TaxID=63359 RepID=A0AAP0S0Q4_LIQFO
MGKWREESSEPDLLRLVAFILWRIWKARNNKCFIGKEWTLREVILKATGMAKRIKFMGSAQMVEAIALREGIRFALDTSIIGLVVEADAKGTIELKLKEQETSAGRSGDSV